MCVPLISSCIRWQRAAYHHRHKNTPGHFYGLINKTAEPSMKISFLLSTLSAWLSGRSSLFIVYVHIHFSLNKATLVGGRVGCLPVCQCGCLRAGRQRRWLSSAVRLEPGVAPGITSSSSTDVAGQKVWLFNLVSEPADVKPQLFAPLMFHLRSHTVATWPTAACIPEDLHENLIRRCRVGRKWKKGLLHFHGVIHRFYTSCKFSQWKKQQTKCSVSKQPNNFGVTCHFPFAISILTAIYFIGCVSSKGGHEIIWR